MATFKDNSRSSWIGNATVEHINAGSLQRIADATELMAKNHAELIEKAERAKRDRDYWAGRASQLERRVSALRGCITKLKKQKGNNERED